MSFEITEAFVTQWGTEVQRLAQQQMSRLREAVMVKSGMTGNKFEQPQIGKTRAEKRAARHADTPLVQTPHQRRWGHMSPYDWADLIDATDKLQVLADPTNAYSQNAASALARAMDEAIIDALKGAASSGENGTESVSLPAAQKIAAASSGLTLAKLRSAAQKLRAAEAYGMMNEWYLALTAAQLDDLLGTTEVTSADYNTVRALVQGEIDTFLGFKFLHTELLPKTGTSRSVLAWAKSGVCLGVGKDIERKVEQRPDKNYAWQVYACMHIGAVRLEENKVIEIACQES